MAVRLDLVFRDTTRTRGRQRPLLSRRTVLRVVGAAWPLLNIPRGHTAELAVTLVGQARMRAMNRRWRKVDAGSDVLSFPLPMKPIAGYTAVSLGDIFICPAVVCAKAAASANTVRDQMQWTLVHGLLHLVGYDHPDAGRSGPRLKRRGEKMFSLEQKILRSMK